MIFDLIIEEKALREAQDAFDYYEQQQNGLGERFKNELDKSVNNIRTNPKNYSKIKDGIRQKSLDKFPFLVVYEVFEETIIIYAIFHQKRNPKQKFRKE